MAWPKGRSRRATYKEREVRPSVDDGDVQDRKKSKAGPAFDGERGEIEGEAQVSISVKEAEYQGVSVEHPSIRTMVENMVKRGHRTDDIQRLVGMPREVIERIQRDTKR